MLKPKNLSTLPLYINNKILKIKWKYNHKANCNSMEECTGKDKNRAVMKKYNLSMQASD